MFSAYNHRSVTVNSVINLQWKCTQDSLLE